MSHLVVGTAGHIDHGKTSLVRALTGIETDRLKEEKLRGITIELGFAYLELADTPPVGIVDVPGHEKFVHHMVAGVAGIDLVVLVIAADEGVMPQTREHLDICRLLGVTKGLVALTKTDLVEKEWIEMVTDDIRQFVAGTFLESSPVIPVSSVTGDGLPELRASLRAALQGIPSRVAAGVPRLPVDRVFTMKGFGTVTTGTLVAGSLKVGEAVEVLPAGRQYRIRGLQVHGESVTKAFAGQRTAVNLQGAEKSALHRGDVITGPGAIAPSFLMDARLQLLAGNSRPLANRTRVRLHLGTSEILARVVILGQEDLEPGGEAMVQFRLEAPGVALPRDHFVIRSYSPAVTLGGGVLIDTHPPKHKKYSSSAVASLKVLAGDNAEDSALLLLGEAGGKGLDAPALGDRLNLGREEAFALLDRLTRKDGAVRVSGKPPVFLHPDALSSYEAQCLSLLSAFHRDEPLKAGISREELKSRLARLNERAYPHLLEKLVSGGKIVAEKDLVRLREHKVSLRSDQAEVKRKVEAYYRRVGLQPPVQPVIAGELSLERAALSEAVSLLLADGVLVKITEEMAMHSESISGLREKVVEYLTAHGEIDMPAFKDLSGLSRKYSIPVMEYFDRSGVTVRVGDVRKLRKSS
jgi:selenocysteine-specific elongation factor